MSERTFPPNPMTPGSARDHIPRERRGTFERLDTALSRRRPANGVARTDLLSLTHDVDELLAIENRDAILRRAVELARDRIGLVRVSMYMFDQIGHFMQGTWSSAGHGAIEDEHDVVYAMISIDRQALRPRPAGGQFTVLGGYLIVDHGKEGAKFVRPRWIVSTPIRCGERLLGMMLNHSGPLKPAVDEAKQAKAAILCSVLGAALGSLPETQNEISRAKHRLAMAAVARLAKDPAVATAEIAAQLGVSAQRLTRSFEAKLGVSLVEYRNRVRLDRVALLMADGRRSLAGAAVAAGFDSCAHFQQASRMFRWMAALKELAENND